MRVEANTASPLSPSPFRVITAREEIRGCVTLCVEPATAAGDCGFTPGQFYMIYVFGHGEVPVSVSGDPAKTGELTFTVMAVGSVTRALCRVKPGDTIGLRGPFGSAWPVAASIGRDIIVMAGGLGLAPLRPALYQMLHNRGGYGQLTLLYGTREPESVLFKEQLAAWCEHGSLEVDVTVDNAGHAWLGKVGVVTDLLQGRNIDHARTSVLICGPEIMMRYCAHALLDLGIAAENIYLSMERNMKCAVKMCGRCQYGPFFICEDGPVFAFDRVARLFTIREI
jgi:NAD(P)H-flavin reductase